LITVAQLAEKLQSLPAELQDAPVAVYSESDEGGDIVAPRYGTDEYIKVQRAGDHDSLLYYKSDNPVKWRELPVLVTIIG
jgi:hypothetical protein